MTAQEARWWGIVNEVVPLPDLMPTVHRGANEIFECSPLAVRASKQCAVMEVGMTRDEALAQRYPALKQRAQSEDVKEDPRAFAEKQKPNWKGK